MTIQVTAHELSYIDKAAGNDKFYRVFTYGETMVIQYGRNGTIGTFKRTTHTNAAEAQAAGAKQADSKFKKGYERVKSAVLAFTDHPNDSQLDIAMTRASHMVDIAGALESQTAVRAQAVIELNDTSAAPVDTTILPAVRANLTAAGLVEHNAGSAAQTVVRPMLAETCNDTELAEMMGSDSWCAQLKLDGERFVIEVIDGNVAVYNRQGQPKTSNVAENILAAFRNLTEGRWVFDGEIVGRKLWLFDIIAAGGHIADDAPFDTRLTALSAVMGALAADSAYVEQVDTAYGTDDKQTLLDTVIAENREGVIFRTRQGQYEMGRRSTQLRKHKLLKEADCYITEIHTAKASATVAVRDENGDEIVVGAVSTIGKGALAVGDVVEVRFLYVIDPAHPRMFQPRIMRQRSDKSADECHIAQFENAGANKQM